MASASGEDHKITAKAPELTKEKEWVVYSLGEDDTRENEGGENAGTREQKEPLRAAAAGTGTILFLLGCLAEFIGYRRRL